MRKVFMVLLALLVSASALAQTRGTKQLLELEEVVVTGRYPGPPLWKVSKGDHALWILPLVDMYPRKMEWDSRRVEKLVGQSQEYIERPGVSMGVMAGNPLLLFPVLFRANNVYVKATQLPKGKTLSKMMPADLYGRFQALRSRYFPRKANVDTMTVVMATGTVQGEVLEQENLQLLYQGGPPVITQKLLKWLKANKTIRRVNPSARANTFYKLTNKDTKVLARAMEKVVASPEFATWSVECLDHVITYFERDLAPVKKRANAWATGHIEGLINPTPLFNGSDACSNPLNFRERWPAVKELRDEHPALFAALTPDRVSLMKQARELWLAAAEKAIENNMTTFGMLTINDVLDKDGLVAQLEARGYKVEISAE